MSGVVLVVAVDARIDAHTIVKERLVSSVGKALGAYHRSGALKACRRAGRANVLNLAV